MCLDATVTTRPAASAALMTSRSVVTLLSRTRSWILRRSSESSSRITFATSFALSSLRVWKGPGTGASGVRSGRHQLLDGRHQQVGAEWLDDPALGSRLLGPLDQVGVVLAGQHHDWQL